MSRILISEIRDAERSVLIDASEEVNTREKCGFAFQPTCLSLHVTVVALMLSIIGELLQAHYHRTQISFVNTLIKINENAKDSLKNW